MANFKTPSSNFELLLFSNRYYMDYGSRHTDVQKWSTSVESLYKSRRQAALTDRVLVASCSLNGRFIPMVDCDSAAAYSTAKDYLAKRDIQSASFVSNFGAVGLQSERHYWIFPDVSFLTFSAAARLAENVPGGDKSYLKMSRERECFVVRAEPRRGNAPLGVSLTDCRDSVVYKFAHKLRDHFNSVWVLGIPERK